MTNRASLVFDLDGTLVDTAPDLLRVTQIVTAPYGVASINTDQLRNWVGYGAKHLMASALKDHEIEISEDQLASAVQDFLKVYEESISELSRPFPGVLTTLTQLKRQGYALSVATNKPGYLARRLLDELDMTPFFDNIIGGGDVENKKPHAEHIYAACGHCGRRSIIVIGDSAPDVGAARAAGAKAIIMSYGYNPGAPESLNADVVLRHFGQLPSALSKIL